MAYTQQFFDHPFTFVYVLVTMKLGVFMRKNVLNLIY